ncbi:putative UDP-glucose 6-dehydrogenase-like isoform 1 [Capsicum annuum]|nr:putative UDP-glucose 6-dehydrogenase-like isoform 1 [Capsicum annuum]
MFFIAKHKHANQEVLYLSAKIPRGIPFLIELTIVIGIPGVKCTMKTPSPEMAPLFFEAMDGFLLPPFESTCILKNRCIVSVKKKGGVLAIEGNDGPKLAENIRIVEKQPVKTGHLPLENKEFDNESGGYDSEDESEDEEVADLVKLTSPHLENSLGCNVISEKRKASETLPSLEKKKHCSEVSEKVDEQTKKSQQDLTSNKSLCKQKEVADPDSNDVDKIKGNAESSKVNDSTSGMKNLLGIFATVNLYLRELFPNELQNSTIIVATVNLYLRELFLNELQNSASIGKSRNKHKGLDRKVGLDPELGTITKTYCGHYLRGNDEFQEKGLENVEATTKPERVKKGPSRSARKQYAKRQWLREMIKLYKNVASETEGLTNAGKRAGNLHPKWLVNSETEGRPKGRWNRKQQQSKDKYQEVIGQPKGLESNQIGQPKGLLHWKQSREEAKVRDTNRQGQANEKSTLCEKPEHGDMEDEIVPVLMGEDRIYYHAGFKSFEISKTSSKSETWFEWTERSRNLMRKVSLSRKVMKWLVHVFNDASKEQKMSTKRWKTRDLFAEFYCNLKYNEHGRYISFIAVQGGNRSVIISPEIALNAGWAAIAQKMEKFIATPTRKGPSTFNQQHQHQKSSFAESIRSIKWSSAAIKGATPQISNSRIKVAGVSEFSEDDVLGRCIVGKFMSASHEIPTLNDEGSRTCLERRVEVEEVHSESGLVDSNRRMLAGRGIMNLGDACGGWIETEEETILKNHLCWARIKVKGDGKAVPRDIEMESDGYIFNMPIWCEIPTTVKKRKMDGKQSLPPLDNNQGQTLLSTDLSVKELYGHVGPSVEASNFKKPACDRDVRFVQLLNPPLPVKEEIWATTTTNPVYSHIVRPGEGKMYAVNTTTSGEVARLFPIHPQLKIR